MPQTETNRAFAARHGVSLVTVNDWRRAGYIVRAADGRIDVEASNARLSLRPARYRGGRARGPCGSDRGGRCGPAVAGGAWRGVARRCRAGDGAAFGHGVPRVPH